jgi:hypothetical protein
MSQILEPEIYRVEPEISEFKCSYTFMVNVSVQQRKVEI